jgi:DNA primase
MFDYLTIVQYTDNVIGMKSCDRNWTQDEIDYLNSFDQVKVLLDNDDAGRKGIKKINEILTTNVYVMNFIEGEKDVNEARVKRETNTFLAYIKDNLIPSKVKPFTHITY